MQETAQVEAGIEAWSKRNQIERRACVDVSASRQRTMCTTGDEERRWRIGFHAELLDATGTFRNSSPMERN